MLCRGNGRAGKRSQRKGQVQCQHELSKYYLIMWLTVSKESLAVSHRHFLQIHCLLDCCLLFPCTTGSVSWVSLVPRLKLSSPSLLLLRGWWNHALTAPLLTWCPETTPRDCSSMTPPEPSVLCPCRAAPGLSLHHQVTSSASSRLQVRRKQRAAHLTTRCLLHRRH